jgi:hypothetical protein
MEGLLPTSVQVDFTPSNSRPAALARTDCGFSPPNETRIADELVARGSTKGSLCDWVQFLAIMLTALALVPSGAHLAALPNKMAMARAAYFVAQQIYAGWAPFGIVQFGALMANLAHAVVLGKLDRSSFLLIAANPRGFCYPRGQVVAIDLEPGDA